MNIPVFDLHCDTASRLLGDDLRSPKHLRENDLHIDLNRAKVLENYCQCFACFTTPFMQEWYGHSPETIFQLELDIILAELERNRGTMSQVFSTEEIRKNVQKGIASAILTIEGPAGFGYDPELLEQLYRVGFRISTLGWNEKNPLTGSHKTGGGLTDMGKEYVKECQRLGILVDVSHISDEGFWDIMDITDAPVIASHSNSRNVWNESRNLTDDMFRAIAQTGGVAGFNLCAEFIGGNPTVDTACDHILHFLELDPSGKHIALGGDLDGIDNMPEGFAGIQDYPKFADRLLEHGLTESMIYDIFWNNAIGVMENAVRNYQK